MHSKIINPKVHGKAVYENKGSSSLLVAYLQHEVKEKGGSLRFFNDEAGNISPEEVQQRIDYNVKGLRKTESKFIALVLSPSTEELRHIGNDEEKLKQFTFRAMQHYAENFHLKAGKVLGSADLLWFGAIHHHRTYKGKEKEVKEGQKKSGELKPGLNMHVHIIVSKRDREQQITLSPFGNRSRFDMDAWQRRNQEEFNRIFGFEPQLSRKEKKENSLGSDQRDRLHSRIRERVERINLYLDTPHQLKPEQVLAVAERRNYHKTFFLNLNRLEQKLKNYQYVRDPMHLLEHNRDRKPLQQLPGNSLAASVKHMAESCRKMGFTEPIGLKNLSPKKRKQKERHQK
jgi:hypothetical protein